MDYFIGVDPGKSPAICVLNCVEDIVLLSLVKDKGDFPYREWIDEVDKINDLVGSNKSVVVCEKPHSVFGASAKSNQTFGQAIGSCIDRLYDIYEPVLKTPKAWQKEVLIDADVVKVNGKKDTKATALAAAKRLRGDRWKEEDFLPTKRSRVVNHNLVDAYLIAMSEYLKTI